MIKKILGYLSGKKTYIIAAGMIIGAVSLYVAGSIDGARLGQIFLEALAIAGLRAGVAKTLKK